MRRFFLPLVIIAPMLCVLAAGAGQGGLRAAPKEGGQQTPGDQRGALTMTITTGGGLFGPARDRYRVGHRIPVVISMTNQGREPVYLCDTSTLYQDRPRLLKEGRPVPQLDMQELMTKADEREKTCKNLDEDLDDFMEQRLLKPGETAVVDWFILTEGATPQGDLAWYGSLPPGKYELSTRRLMGCCEGQWVESNKINFEVIP